MKRDWNIIENILSHIEAGDIERYVKEERYLKDLDIDADDYLGHLELLIDAKIIKNCEAERGPNGHFEECYFEGVFITMQGHDLLDAIRNKKCGRVLRPRRSVLALVCLGNSSKLLSL